MTKKILLLCVDDKGLRKPGPVREGRTYTKAFPLRCPCGKGDALVTLAGIRWPGGRVRQGCIACKKPLDVAGLTAYLASRFIEINDPDAQIERRNMKELVT